ncbi:MAG: 2-C-methyl-D-erythritol 4-phosphate cytidylyltransferase [Lentimicrobiaceae bacterium]|nr:2-C-methyl-D-erythritol 4-phosphate cytidylyltransferase [Lentimicrobiaceae bacterium]
MKNIALIFAGGSGVRMNTKSRPKQFLELNGKPIIIYTIELFDNHPEVDAIVVVCIEKWIPFLNKMLKKFEINKVVRIVPGGVTSQDSIFRGLCEIESYINEEGDKDAVVMIHDGVRPLIIPDTISSNIAKVKECGSSITVIPATETFVVKCDDGSLHIPDRSNCVLARAPQSFKLTDILSVHRRSRQENNMNFVDSCSMMSYYGYKLGIVEGPVENIKITTPTDYFVFRAMVEVHENQQIFGIFG